MKVPAEGGTVENVSPVQFRPNDISPDGTRLIGTGWSEAEKRIAVEMMNLTDKTVTVVPLPGVGFFMPDGGYAVPQRIQSTSIYTVFPAKEKTFRAITPPNPEFFMAGAVSKSGRVAFARGAQISDVVLIKGK